MPSVRWSFSFIFTMPSVRWRVHYVDDIWCMYFPAVFEAFQSVVTAEGLGGLYKGFWPTLLRDVPEIAIQVCFNFSPHLCCLSFLIWFSSLFCFFSVLFVHALLSSLYT